MSDKAKKEKRSVQGAGFLLWKASNAWQRVVREHLKSVGITQVQYLLLEAIHLHESKGTQPTQIALSRTAGTDVMMTSKVIRTLETQKLVARKGSRTDARSMVLTLTAEGKKKLARATTAMHKSEEIFFAKLVAKPHKFVMNLAALAEDNQ